MVIEFYRLQKLQTGTEIAEDGNEDHLEVISGPEHLCTKKVELEKLNNQVCIYFKLYFGNNICTVLKPISTGLEGRPLSQALYPSHSTYVSHSFLHP